MTSDDLAVLYKKFNKKYFGNKLPRILYVHYGKLPKTGMGRTRFQILCKSNSCEACVKIRSKYQKEIKTDRIPIEIIITDTHRKETTQSRLTLLHEMVHISIGGKYKHGSRFKKEVKRLFAAGAYNRLL